MPLSKEDSNALQGLASSSRNIQNDINIIKEQGWGQLETLDAIHTAIKAGKGSGKDSGGIGDFFKDLSSASKSIKDGGQGLKTFAEGISRLSKALIKFVAVPGKNKLPIFFNNISEAFSKAGNKEDDIKKGIGLTSDMSKALLAFGGSLALSSILFIIGAPGAVIAAAAIGGLGLVFSAIGRRSDNIKEGAGAVLFMGVAITSLAIGIYFWQKTLGNDPTSILLNTGILVITLGALALTFGLAGKFAKNIVMGSAALAIAGISILSISLGLAVFKKAEWGFMDLGILSATIVSMGVIFALAGIPVVAGLIALGAGALIIAGLSLIGISTGLASFKKLNFDEEDGKKLKIAISSLSDGFSSLSLEGIGKMTLAVPGLIGAGLGLISISKGLKVFKKIEFNPEDSEKLKLVITGLAEAFAVAGGSKPAPGSSLFQKVFFGEPNIVEKGIESVLNAGKALKSITDGLKSWKSLADIGLGKDAFNANKEGTMLWNIKATVGAINEVFSAIGRGGGEDDRSLFGKLFFAKRTDTEKGINAVKDIGMVLTNISTGLKEWMDLSNKGIDIKKITGNIKHVLTAVSKSFAQIGGKEEEDSALFGLIKWDENLIEKGIDAVKGVGKELEGIASGLKIFSDLKKVGLKETDFDPNTKGSLMWNIAQTITGVAKIFSGIAKGEFISEGWLWDDNLVEEGISAVAGIGPELESISKSMKSFSDLQDGVSSKIAKSLKDIFMVVSDSPEQNKIESFSELGDQFERIAKLEDPFENIAKSFSRIAREMGTFTNNFNKMDRFNVSTFSDFTSAMISFSQIKKSNFLLNSSVAQDFIERSSRSMTIPPVHRTQGPIISQNDKSQNKLIEKNKVEPAPASISNEGSKEVQHSSASKRKTRDSFDGKSLEMTIRSLQEEIRKMNGSMNRIETTLQGTLRVENID